MVTKGKIRKGQFGLQTPEQIFQSNFAFNGSNIGSVTGALDPNKLGGLTYNFANDPSIIQQLDQNSSNFDLLATANSMIQMKDPKGGTSLIKTNLNKFLGNVGKTGFLSKANGSLNKELIKGSGLSIGSAANGVLSVADRFIPQAEDKASKITSGVFNGLSTVASFMPGIGTLASVALKGLGSLFGAGVKSVKGNTANELVDTSSSYTGEDALASKKFGLLGLRGAKKYAGLVAQRQYNRDLAANVLQEGKDDLLAANNVQQQQMRDTLSKNGDDWMYTNTLSAKNGAKIKEIKRLSSLYNKRLISKEPLKEGTTELQNGGNIKNRSIGELIEYAKKVNPRFIQRLSEPPRGIDFIDDEGQPARGSHYLESAGEYVIPRIQEINGKLKFLSHEDAVDRALKTNNYLKLTPEEAIDFAKNYKQGWPDFFQKFKNGGSINVIPEGALHARKNNLTEINPELEGITKKGIPVISKEEGGEMIQHAEIERSEIIFNLETTKKLESLREQYNKSEDKSEKDNLAIEAGKLLAQQIMENTIDNTGELLK